MPYNKEIKLSNHLSVIFRDTGHILGSALLEVFVHEDGKDTKIVFSGDLGQPHQPIIKDPTTVSGADFVLVESTFISSFHQFMFL